MTLKKLYRGQSVDADLRNETYVCNRSAAATPAPRYYAYVLYTVQRISRNSKGRRSKSTVRSIVV